MLPQYGGHQQQQQNEGHPKRGYPNGDGKAGAETKAKPTQISCAHFLSLQLLAALEWGGQRGLDDHSSNSACLTVFIASCPRGIVFIQEGSQSAHIRGVVPPLSSPARCAGGGWRGGGGG